MAWVKAYHHTKWHLDPSRRLSTTDMDRKVGAAVPLVWGAGSSCNTMWPGQRPTPVPSGILIHVAVWLQHMGQNWGCYAPFWGRGAGSPSNIEWPGPRPTCMPSFILIHLTVWPQYTNVTDRTDRQRSYNLGRTVLQTVTQQTEQLTYARLPYFIKIQYSTIH